MAASSHKSTELKLLYPAKIAYKELLAKLPATPIPLQNADCTPPNLLFHGDNLRTMRSLMECPAIAGKVRLVYIDPPFSTRTVYKASSGRVATVSSSHSDDVAYTDMLQGTAYIEFLRRRLLLLRELMAPNASIYLHIDYKIGHYVKVMMDEVFGVENFRNDITRIKCNPKNFTRKSYGNIKDMILFYGLGDLTPFSGPLLS